MTTDKILSLLPYAPPFLFVDSLEIVDENGVKGCYTYPADAFFYRGHFKNFPITPGVILTETMAQIGLVCLGIYLIRDQIAMEKKAADGLPGFAMSANTVNYYRPVFPGETVSVVSEKVYFRFGKLKCKVEMRNNKEELVCKGTIEGMTLAKRK